MNNLSAPTVGKNHDVDTLLALDRSRTIQGNSHDFCIRLRFDFQRWPHLGIRVARLARPTKSCELIPWRLASNGRADSHHNLRPRPTSVLDAV
jgi:hypothetical protein